MKLSNVKVQVFQGAAGTVQGEFNDWTSGQAVGSRPLVREQTMVEVQVSADAASGDTTIAAFYAE